MSNPKEVTRLEKKVKALRKKLSENGQSLKWWHSKYTSGVCRYDYLVRQVNSVDCLMPDVLRAISGYLDGGSE